jgi:regulator of nucleoside diphosphate kinase
MTTSRSMESAVFESGLPPIAMTIADRERLERLANASIARFPQTAEYLAREVERARTLEPGHDGRQFVRMGAWVEFRDDRSGQMRRVSLIEQPVVWRF